MGVNSFSSQLAVNVSETSQANDQGRPLCQVDPSLAPSPGWVEAIVTGGGVGAQLGSAGPIPWLVPSCREDLATHLQRTLREPIVVTVAPSAATQLPGIARSAP